MYRDEDFMAYANAESNQARQLYTDGFIRQIWHRADVPGACILLEAESEAHAREILRTLPLMRAGMLEVTIVPLKPYMGFAPEPRLRDQGPV